MSKKATGHRKQVSEHLMHAARHITRLDAMKQQYAMLTSRRAT